MKYIMALDQGTTSSRCILFDKTGKICSMAQKEFTQIYPEPGWVEHSPMEIWSSQLAVGIEAMAMLGVRAEDIAGIGITNQRETLSMLWIFSIIISANRSKAFSSLLGPSLVGLLYLAISVKH